MTEAFAPPRTVVEDERGRGIPAVVRYGPYAFVSGSDGYRRLDDEQIDPKLAEHAVEQCRNAYGRVARRLAAAGFGDDGAVWIQNFTSGQHWRLERMALWPEYFGEENHLRAVSFGAQTRMDGINMLTAVVMAIDPVIERHVAVSSPGRGRASRCTRIGDLTFVIGVRGYENLATKRAEPQETPDSLDRQIAASYDNLGSHLRAANGSPADIVRADATLRAARFVDRYEKNVRARFDGAIPFASYAVGTPLGGHGELEVGAIATAPGVTATRRASAFDPARTDTTTAGGLTFARLVSGAFDERNGALRRELLGDTEGQVRNVVANLEALFAGAGTSVERAVRFDVFLRDIYAQDEILALLRAELGNRLPALSFLGAEPRAGAELEIAAIAAAGAAA